jgi:hypothetical protein
LKRWTDLKKNIVKYTGISKRLSKICAMLMKAN